MSEFFPKLPPLQEAPKSEDEVRAYWERCAVFQSSVEDRPAEKTFVFYEGPPTANGKPGAHHVPARLFKDVFCRYRTMRGHRVVRKAGWDTHGLPVEIEVEKELGLVLKQDIERFGVEEFNRVCRESVFRYKQEWEDFTRLMGYWVDLDDPYVTYENDYIESVWAILKKFWEANLIYRGHKVVPYCPRCGTTLSSHEMGLGYRDVTETSVYVKFALEDEEDAYVLAWTTTPWTLPGNVALAVGENVPYIKVAQERNGKTEHYYLSRSLIHILEGPYEEEASLSASELARRRYQPLFDFLDLRSITGKDAYYITPADFVTTEDGTGVVHTAVMYGEVDYVLGDKIGLPKLHTVDEQGNFTESVGPFAGRNVKDAEPDIIEYLRDHGLLYKPESITHSYPFCWRCSTPLLYYARASWYIRTTSFKEKLLEVNRSVHWIPPEVGTGRFGDWLENNVDWALSRDRYWGTPLPIWVCQGCEESVCIGSVEELRERGKGVPSELDLHKPAVDEVVVTCTECGGDMRRAPEVIDVWFDSGSMPYAQYHYPFENQELFENQFPADFICEGIDQSRGWFYSLMAISAFVSGRSSYKRVLVTGLIQDKDGQKMSKSRGNAVDPIDILEREGADALRWNLTHASPPWSNTRFDREGVTESIRKMLGTLANVYGFFALYANLDGFRPSRKAGESADPMDEVVGDSMTLLDRWIVASYDTMVTDVTRHYEAFDPTRAVRRVQEFVMEDLSNWYIRLNRRRYWKEGAPEDKRAAYETLYRVIFGIVRLTAPVIPFLSDRIYLGLQGMEPSTAKGSEVSVHSATFPEPEFGPVDDGLLQKMHRVRQIVTLGRALRNQAGVRVRQPLSQLAVHMKGGDLTSLLEDERFRGLIEEELNVREVAWLEDVDSVVKRTLAPRFKVLGPRLGKRMKAAADALKNVDTGEVQKLSSGEPIELDLAGESVQIRPEEVDIKVQGPEGAAAGSEGPYTGVLALELSPELEAEGLAREVVNRLQNLRKSINLEVMDRIELIYRADPKLDSALRAHREHVMTEVLAVRFDAAEGEPDWQRQADLEIDGEAVTFWIRRHEPVTEDIEN